MQSQFYDQFAPSIGSALYFTDSLGDRWQVFELRCADGSLCLIFESRNTLRRIQQYPDGWRQLDATALCALGWVHMAKPAACGRAQPIV